MSKLLRYDDSFVPTQDMIDRHERWLDKYTQGILDGWIKQGLEPGDPDAAIALQAIREEMQVPSRPQWMRPERALAVIASWTPGVLESPIIDMQDALRTRAGFEIYQWRSIVSETMGIGEKQVKLYEKAVGCDDTKEPTYLYKFYDKSDNLLYIGITNEPTHRFERHQKTSMWWSFAVRHEIEEKDTRQQAFRDEIKAIKTERPIFNKTGSERDHTDAVHYIMNRSNLEPDTLF